MKQTNRQNAAKAPARSPLDAIKPGSDPKHVDLPHDFGVPVEDTVEVRYASHAAREQDRGQRQVRSSDEQGGRRDVGVGVDTGGAGAGSGGDIDPDIVGVGTHGSGLSQSPRLASERAAISDAKPAQPRDAKDSLTKAAAPSSPARAGDETDIELNPAGADAIRNDAGDDPFRDATSGEISSDESNGTDNDEGVAAEEDEED